VLTVSSVTDLTYRQTIIDRLDRQTQKGLKKYDAVLSHYTDMPIEKRLEHLAEELTDALVYIEHLKAWVKDNE
jgi:hypothetical protein